MNVAIYGGSFDPLHNGHLAVARAAAERHALKRIYFVPANIQPLKRETHPTPYYHRYAMLALGLQAEKTFVPSLLEAPEVMQAEGLDASYSIDTVRRLKQRLKKNDKVSFLIGIDSFQTIRKWRNAIDLLRECEFIVVSRPGYSLADIAEALPDELRPPDEVTRVLRNQQATGDIVHGGAVIHLLTDVKVPVSSTQVRTAAASGKSIARFVPEQLADYIKKMKLYTREAEEGNPEVKPTQRDERTITKEPAAGSTTEQRSRLQIVHRRGHSSKAD